jgi:hypothetical protein
VIPRSMVEGSGIRSGPPALLSILHHASSSGLARGSSLPAPYKNVVGDFLS